MKRCRILVVGGVAGLALARALDEAGFAPHVIERAAGWQVSGAGMYLQANGATRILHGHLLDGSALDPSFRPEL